MDLLFKRYASPFLIVDEMLSAGMMQKFFINLYKKENEELQWEYWLHKVYDMDFETYKSKCAEHNKSYAMSTKQVDATINKSRGILKRFNPV